MQHVNQIKNGTVKHANVNETCKDGYSWNPSTYTFEDGK